MPGLWDLLLNQGGQGGLFGVVPAPADWRGVQAGRDAGPSSGPAIDYSAIGGTPLDLRGISKLPRALRDFLMQQGPAFDPSAIGGAVPDTFGAGAQPQSLYNINPSGFGFQAPTTTPPVLAPPGMPGGAPQAPVAMLENRPPPPPPLTLPTDLPPAAQPTGGAGLPAAAMPLPTPPPAYRPPPQMYQPPPQDFGANIAAGFQNLLHRPNLAGIGDAITGFQTGQRTDPLGYSQQMQQRTYDALRSAGYDAPTAALAAVNPEVMKLVAANAFAQPKFEKVAPGETPYLVGGGAGRLGAGAPGTTVTQLPGGMSLEQSEEAKKIGGGRADQYAAVQTAAQTATKQLGTLQRLKQLNDLAPGGAGAPAYLHARSLLTTLGIAPDSVRAGEEFTALSNKLVLDSLNGSLGTGVSNADRSFIEQTVPALAQSAAGRRQLIDTMEKLGRRNIEMAQLADKYREANGSMAGFTSAAARYAEQNPIFAPPTQGPGSRPISVGSPAEAARLPRGTRFIDPNGVTRMVP